MQEAAWSTRKLRLIFGLVGAAVLTVAVWLLRQAAPDLPNDSAEQLPNSFEPQPTNKPLVPDIDTPPGPIAINPTDTDPVDGNPLDDDPLDVLGWEQGGQFVESVAVEDIATALKEAAVALEAGQLVEPADDNALQRYLAVLQLEPDNTEASEGLQLVGDELLTRLNQLLEDRQVDEAARLFPALLQVRPEDPARDALGDQLKQLQLGQQLAIKVAQNLAAGRLIEPPDRSAFGRAQQLLQTDPEHPQLDELMDSVEMGLVDRALTSARELAFDQAQAWLGLATDLRGGSALVIEGGLEVEDIRRAELDRREAETYRILHSYQFDQVTSMIDASANLGAEPDRIERMRDALRLGRLYGNYEPGMVISDPLSGVGVAPPMIVIAHGSFLMGSSSREDGHVVAEEPQFEVSFRRGFALGKTEVTVAQFAQFVRASGYVTDAERTGFSLRYFESTGRLSRSHKVSWRDDFEGRKAQDDDPVTHVSWADAKAYANWLSEQSGQPYRLPTEAEFEYALRAGSESRFWWGDAEPAETVENLTGSRDRSRHRNQWASSFEGYNDGYWGPAPVASFAPNGFALYDMAGNLSEWVEDCWHDSYVRAPTDGSAWVNRGCERRVIRGGYWGGSPNKSRSAYRSGYPPTQRGGSIGFRVARDLYPEPNQLIGQANNEN